MPPESAKLVVLACCVLHNVLMSNGRNRARYLDRLADCEQEFGEFEGGAWRTNQIQLGSFVGEGLSNTTTADGRRIRDQFADYFVSEGRVDFQNQHVAQSDSEEDNEEMQAEN